MNPPPTPPQPRRRRWPWILAGLVAVPLLAGGLAVWSLLRLGSDAAQLRDDLMAACGGRWETRVQVTLNPLLVAAARAVVGLVHDVPDEAHLALRAVRSVSVGVYERPRTGTSVGSMPDWVRADRTMAARGWTRLAAVVEPGNIVLVYVPAGRPRAEPSRVCLAVCGERELVVVAGRIRADAVADLASRELAARQAWLR